MDIQKTVHTHSSFLPARLLFGFLIAVSLSSRQIHFPLFFCVLSVTGSVGIYYQFAIDSLLRYMIRSLILSFLVLPQ